jgi:hypothetical protein
MFLTFNDERMIVCGVNIYNFLKQKQNSGQNNGKALL